MGKKLFFSTEGIDWNDDAAIEAFAHAVWEASVTKFKEDDEASATARNNQSHEGGNDE